MSMHPTRVKMVLLKGFGLRLFSFFLQSGFFGGILCALIIILVCLLLFERAVGIFFCFGFW